jgi:hypothetical protein
VHCGSFGFLVQSTGGSGGSGTLTHSGEVDPCLHVGGGGGVVVNLFVVGLLSPSVPPLLSPPLSLLPPPTSVLLPSPLFRPPSLLPPEDSLDFLA